MLSQALTLISNVLFLTILTSGCVSTKTHNHLKQEFQTSQSELKEARYLLFKSANQRRLDSETIQSLQRRVLKLSSEQHLNKSINHSLVRENDRLIHSLELANHDLELAKRLTQKKLHVLTSYQKQIQKLFKPGFIEVRIERGRLLVSMPTDILFDSGSDKLSTQGTRSLEKLAKVFSTRSNQIQVEGHTDSDPIKGGSFKSNWHLAYARAMSVVKVFLKQGIQQNLLSAASYGEYQPRASNQTAQGKNLNRRIEVVLIPDLSQIIAQK